jgi:hypothetical protein
MQQIHGTLNDTIVKNQQNYLAIALIQNVDNTYLTRNAIDGSGRKISHFSARFRSPRAFPRPFTQSNPAARPTRRFRG